jgi:hypothetical protein
MTDNEKSKWSDLEAFSHTGARRGDAIISISERKFFTFSAGFLHQAKEQIGDKTHVLLLHSKSLNAIVFEFVNSEEAGALKLSKNINAIVSARSFFNFYNIDAKTYAGKYRAQKENIPAKGLRWVIYLNDKISSTS